MSYKIPLRLEILRRLTAALDGTDAKYGFDLDLKDRIFRGRAVFGHDDPVPLVSILEAPMQTVKTHAPVGGSGRGTTWELVIQGFTDTDPKHPTDPAHPLLAELQYRLSVIRKGLNGKPFNILGDWNTNGSKVSPILNLEIGAGTVRPPDEVSSSYSHFWLTLTLEVAEDMSKPFDY